MKEIKVAGWNKNTKTMIDLKKVTPLAVLPQVSKHTDGIFIPFNEDLELIMYTGEKDLDKKEIWQAHIVQMYVDGEEFDICEVVFHKGGFKYKSCDTTFSYDLYYTMDDRTVKIIGNTFENPELLKGGDN